MNEKVNFRFIIIGFVAGFICAGIICGIAIWRNDRRSSGEIAELNRRYNELDREYTERQRDIEDNVERCIEFVGIAREITDRTGANSSTAISNLSAARDFIKQGIKEKEALKMELDNIRSGLYGIRDMVGGETE